MVGLAEAENHRIKRPGGRRFQPDHVAVQKERERTRNAIENGSWSPRELVGNASKFVPKGDFWRNGECRGRSEPLLFDAAFRRKDADYGVFDELLAAGSE